MAVTHNPAGYTGTVDQIDEAQRFALGGGGRFKVNSSADWAVTADGAVNRTVNVAAGSAAACGVLDVTIASDAVAFAANAGTTDRFDALVASFNWADGSVAFRIVEGTTVPPVIVRTGTTVDLTKINWLPGTRYDAVLGIIRARPGVTLLAPADLYDCRPWGAWHQLNVATDAFKDQIDIEVGGRLKVTSSDVPWIRASSTSWATEYTLPVGLVLYGSFVYFDPWRRPRFWRVFDTVFFAGEVAVAPGVTLAANSETPIFGLPAGYRPAVAEMAVGAVNGGIAVRIDVEANGDVELVNSTGGLIGAGTYVTVRGSFNLR